MSWISVEDKLPEYNVSVLVFTQKGIVQGYMFEDEEFMEMKGEYVKYDGWQDEVHDDYLEHGNVTHWMIKPDDPKDN